MRSALTEIADENSRWAAVGPVWAVTVNNLYLMLTKATCMSAGIRFVHKNTVMKLTLMPVPISRRRKQ